jgi:hypothetical protein
MTLLDHFTPAERSAWIAAVNALLRFRRPS